MPEENVETVRRWLEGLDAVHAGRQQVQAWAAQFLDADIDYYPVRKFPEARPCHGLEEFSQFMTGYVQAWSSSNPAIQELIEVGDDRVLVCATLRYKGRGSGMRLEGDIYVCMWLRHGHLFRVEDHLTLRGALHALGLEGETLQAAGLRE